MLNTFLQHIVMVSFAMSRNSAYDYLCVKPVRQDKCRVGSADFSFFYRFVHVTKFTDAFFDICTDQKIFFLQFS